MRRLRTTVISWTWEGRSVNSKGLDVRCRVPNGYEAVEQAAKALANKRFKRGNVTFGLTMDRLEQGDDVLSDQSRPAWSRSGVLRDELAGDSFTRCSLDRGPALDPGHAGDRGRQRKR